MLLRETHALDMLHAEALAWTKLHERRKREDGSQGRAQAQRARSPWIIFEKSPEPCKGGIMVFITALQAFNLYFV